MMSLGTESDVRIDWLSGIKVTVIEDVVGLFEFWDFKAMHVVVIVLMAFQSSSLSSVRLWVEMVA